MNAKLFVNRHDNYEKKKAKRKKKENAARFVLVLIFQQVHRDKFAENNVTFYGKVLMYSDVRCASEEYTAR